ncbi:MAG: hypothetical protein K1X89_20120, partial [Myxococcaceae bacterium]|nr:hypothetical protein [Myxococcaceae bacterium]
MKFECSGCSRLEEPRAFRVEQGVTLVLTCAACGAETRATPGLAVPTPRPSAPPTLRSSKDAVNVVALEPPDRRAIDAAAAAA